MHGAFNQREPEEVNPTPCPVSSDGDKAWLIDDAAPTSEGNGEEEVDAESG